MQNSKLSFQLEKSVFEGEIDVRKILEQYFIESRVCGVSACFFQATFFAFRLSNASHYSF